MTETRTFYTAEGHDLQMTLYGRELPDDSPCIIYLHGFKGFKDWGFAPPTGEMLSSHGIRFLAMNFSHNGIGDDPLNFTEYDKFRDNKLSLEHSEARQVITAYQKGELFGDTSKAKTGLLGHSRGGGMAVLVGSHLSGLSAVCTWAAVSYYERYAPEVIDAWRESGLHEVRNARTGQVMHLGWGLHADLLQHKDELLNVEKAARNIGKPLCIIHGTNDPAVELQDGKNLHEWAGPGSEFHIIDGAAHTFGASQPWKGSTPHLDEVWDHTLNFFKKHLNT